MTDLNVKGWNILIVDDEADNLMVLEVLFSFYDAVVTTSRSGEKALDLLCNNTYRLALLDLQMPKVSGWDLVKRVREHTNPTIRNTPLIAVTAMAMPGDKERVLASGFDGYISKPLDAVTFVEAVQTILALPGHQHGMPPAAEQSQPTAQPSKPEAVEPQTIQPRSVQPEAVKAESVLSPAVLPETIAKPPIVETQPKPAESVDSAGAAKIESAEMPVKPIKPEPPAPSPVIAESAGAPVAPVAPAIPPLAPQTRPLPPLPLGNEDGPSNIEKTS